jgi:hypothetical protein
MMIAAATLLSKGVGAVLTLALLGLLFWLDTRHIRGRRIPRRAYSVTVGLGAVLLVVVVARFVAYS